MRGVSEWHADRPGNGTGPLTRNLPFPGASTLLASKQEKRGESKGASSAPSPIENRAIPISRVETDPSMARRKNRFGVVRVRDLNGARAAVKGGDWRLQTQNQ